MNRLLLLLSTSVVALMAAPQLAAAQPLPPPPIWTGFYAGISQGYGFGTNDNIRSVSAPYPGAQIPVFVPGQAVDPLLPAGSVLFNTGVGNALSGNAPHTQSGYVGGGQIGYNYVWGSRFLIGFEADIQGSGIRGASRTAGVGGNSYSSSFSEFVPYCAECEGLLYNGRSVLDSNSVGTTSVNAGVYWLGTVRGRVGYLATPTLLVFATGGLTYGGVFANVHNYAVENVSSTVTTTVSHYPYPYAPPVINQTSLSASQIYTDGGSRSQTLVGWNIGGGLEWMFLPNWSLKTEAIYWNLGSMNVQTAAFSIPNNSGVYGNAVQPFVGATRVNYQGVVARLGLNYHFNFGAAPGL